MASWRTLHTIWKAVPCFAALAALAWIGWEVPVMGLPFIAVLGFFALIFGYYAIDDWLERKASGNC